MQNVRDQAKPAVQKCTTQPARIKIESHLPLWNLKCWSDQVHWDMAGPSINIKGLASFLTVNGKAQCLKVTDFASSGGKNRLELGAGRLKLIIDAEPEGNDLRLQSRLTNLSDEAVFVNSVVIGQLDNNIDSKLELGAPGQTYRIFLNSFDSWGKTGSRPWIKSLGSKPDGDRLHDNSYFVTAVWSTQDKNTLVAGTTEISRFPSVFSWVDGESKNPSFGFGREINIELGPGEEIPVGGFILMQSNDLAASLDEYASRYFKAPATDAKMFKAWSTWDYYLGWPSMEDVRENMEAIKADAMLRENVKVISLDAGWFQINGDWRANIDFESSRAKCAKQIQEAGFIPGIWSMPLLVSPSAKLSVTNLDWFVRDPDTGLHLNMNMGDPLFTDCIYCLDFTVPAVQEYIFDLYRQMYNEGYRYFKLDFLRACCQRPEYPLFDKSVSRSEMLRKCLETVRKAIGNDSAICACGAPFEVVQGIVDFVRTCDDVKNYWSNIQRSARSIVHRAWCHTNLWYNDPDFFVVRGKDTGGMSERTFPLVIPKEHIPFRWISGEPMTLNEAQVWSTVQIMSGGPLVVSDRMATLNSMGKDLIKQVFENYAVRKFLPLDLAESPAPALWARVAENAQVADKDYDMVAVFNWFENPSKVNLEPIGMAGRWRELWTGKEIAMNATVEVAPRSVMLLIK